MFKVPSSEKTDRTFCVNCVAWFLPAQFAHVKKAKKLCKTTMNAEGTFVIHQPYSFTYSVMCINVFACQAIYQNISKM